MARHLVDQESLRELLESFEQAPYGCLKSSAYFPAYVQLFGHLRGRPCTFVEVGILDGGSLFMWRRWLGEETRVIGIDLNPESRRWEEHGFEVLIGDQGDPGFWAEILPSIGPVDALLDDGGHQSFQQIVTVASALAHARHECVIAVEDTYTSFMREFAAHGGHSFLQYAKDATDCVVGRSFDLYPEQFPEERNAELIDRFSDVFSVQFYNGLVAFQISPSACVTPEIVRSPGRRRAEDFRYRGVSSATVEWPDVRSRRSLRVQGRE